MSGAHIVPSSHRLQAALRTGARRRPVPARVGWWQPPRRRRWSSGDEPRAVTPRHREDATTPARELLRKVAAEERAVPPEAPRRPGRRPRRGATGSQHRRPVTPEQRRRRIRLIVLRTVLGALATALLGPVLVFGLGWVFFEVPSPADTVTNQVALISYVDGSPLTRLVPEEGNRIAVPIDEVPVHVREAVLAAEDRTFYDNPGFDLTGILRAGWNQLRGGSGGGSTITQQYVKNALVGDASTLWRKFHEVVLAVRISQERSKDEILGDYLNAIYYGRGAYGIQSAAQAYFGKPVQQLSVAEAALLAGVIQSPSRWDPAINPDRALERWNFVLDGMVSTGALAPADRAATLFPATAPSRRVAAGVPGDSRGHIVTAVRDELHSLGITEEDLAQEGLRVTTTIDPLRQEQAVAATHAALDGQPADLRSAMVAVDPGSGAVRAYYGGENGLGLDYARVRRLAGSTFKPFVVLAGLQQDPPVGIGERFEGEELPGLRNAEGADCDDCDLREAMTVSNNVIFYDLARRVGPENVASAARSAGITAPLDTPTEGIALGNKEVSALELASAYATIAGGGVYHPPHLVSEVVTADGQVLYTASTQGERRFSERVARNVTEAMLEVADAHDLSLPGARPVAAKTGTVQSRFDGENNDAWMAGFTPSLSTSVWLGTDMNSPIRTAEGDPISGDMVPGNVWRDFMGEALEETPVETFAPFRAIGQAPEPPQTTAPVSPSVTPTPTPTPTPQLPLPLPSIDPVAPLPGELQVPLDPGDPALLRAPEPGTDAGLLQPEPTLDPSDEEPDEADDSLLFD